MILLNLNAKSILREQEVNMFFCATIRGSIELNRRCWFVPRKLMTTAPATKYNFNRLIVDRHRRLGMEPLLQWDVSKAKYPSARGCQNGSSLHLGDTDRYIVDVRFVSWAAVISGVVGNGRGCRSCDDMLVFQPRQPVGIVWSVGFYTPLKEGAPLYKDERLKQVTFKCEEGKLARLGELRYVLIERFGVMGRRFDVLDEESEGQETGTLG